jgi:hypothetical protein
MACLACIRSSAAAQPVAPRSSRDPRPGTVPSREREAACSTVRCISCWSTRLDDADDGGLRCSACNHWLLRGDERALRRAPAELSRVHGALHPDVLNATT